MEPRIATLLGDSATHSRVVLDPISSLPPLPTAPRRPLPLEPSPAADDAQKTQANNDYLSSDGRPSRPQRPVVQHRQKSSVPIAEVLNDERPIRSGQQLTPGNSANSTSTPPVPFSGRLSDILLDPSQQHPNKKRKAEVRPASPKRSNNENTLLKLPKLPQLPKKTSRRPRIPPLLQGLHQPPPLPPEGRLFPPITGDGGSFGREINERAPLRSPSGLDSEKFKDIEKEAEKDKEKEQDFGHDDVPGGNSPIAENATSQRSSTLPHGDLNHERSTAERSVKKKERRKQESRKRNRWSEEETKDLLHGVSQFGIGSWKKILNHPDYNFNQRSTVDLKDRFRTCCPKEAVKARTTKATGAPEQDRGDKAMGTGATVMNENMHEGNFTQGVAPVPPSDSTSRRKPRSDKFRVGAAELAEMGIQAPFSKVNRRQRREFTEQDDANLLKGFERYGSMWRELRDDKELGFEGRQATDLRDRFRIRYPERFAKAGYKVKPKDELVLKERVDADGLRTVNDTTVQQKPEVTGEKENDPDTEPITSAPLTDMPPPSGPRAHPLLQPLLNVFPVPLDDFPDIISEDDGEGGNSPVTLNRNIFEWADANPSQSNSTTISTGIPTGTTLAADLNLNFFPGMDGLHINPLATLKLPTASFVHGSNLTAPVFAAPPSQVNLPQQANSAMGSASMNTSLPVANTNDMSTSTKQTLNNALLRTPNLPNIVFPHVPEASARGAVHNLPPPADLLSGMDFELRPESASAIGFIVDDSLNFTTNTNYNTTTNAPTLAPLMGGVSNRIGLLALDSRGLTEDQFGDRSLLNSSI